jgi:hypothetical protein
VAKLRVERRKREKEHQKDAAVKSISFVLVERSVSNKKILGVASVHKWRYLVRALFYSFSLFSSLSFAPNFTNDESKKTGG